MKIVVFGPDKRTGVLHGEDVVDISLAYAKLIHERDGERHPLAEVSKIMQSASELVESNGILVFHRNVQTNAQT